MKRIILALAILLIGTGIASAAAFNCTAAIGCTTGAPCDWATAASWSSCNSTYPANGGGNTYTANIGSGRSIRLATDALTIGNSGAATAALTISGTLKFSDASTGRGTEGFRTLTLVPGSGGSAISMASTAILDIPASSRLLCDTTSTVCTMAMSGTVNIYGTVVDATLQTVAAATTSALCDTTATESEYITMTVDVGQDIAKVGRRIMFYDGQFKNRHFEIASVSGKTIGICTYLPDAGPATDLTCDTATVAASCGQRLTPHVSVGKFPDTTPSANTRHWTPAPTPGNLICVGAFDPLMCCTAANAGTCSNLAPSAGDHIAIIDDVWIGNTGTSNAATFTKTNTSAMWRLYAVNMFGFNAISATSQGLGTETSQDILYGNFHDFVDTDGAVATTGFKDFSVKYNAFHDDGDAVSSSYATFSAVCYSQTAEPCPDNVEISDNVFYRSNGNQIEVSSGPTTVITENVKVNRNLVFEGCHASDGVECGGIEVDTCADCQTRHNVIYDMKTIDDANGSTTPNGDGFRSPGGASNPCTAMSGSDVSHNWIVNVGHTGIDNAQANGCAGRNVGITHNYIANVGRDFVRGGNMYSNVARNGSLLAAALGVNSNVTSMYGNFFIGNESSQATFCGGLCSYTFFGLSPDATYLTPVPEFILQDNVFSRLNYAGPGGLVSGDTNVDFTFDHNLFDSVGSGFDMSGWAPTTYTTGNVTNNAWTHLNNGNFILCSADAEANEQVGYYIRNLSPTAAENTGTFNGTCASTGTSVTPAAGLGFRNRLALDYNYSKLATGRTGASDGSALGVRAFRFNRDSIDDLWGNGLPWDLSVGDPTGATITSFPKNICENGTSCLDTDGDGVLNIHDNCAGVVNPSQYDSDGDGKGDECDR